MGLSPRELDVLRLIAQRWTDPEIAEALFVSPRTVNAHVRSIFSKLEVANRREAATLAAQLGLT
jgi:DNA-binding NarL/FixJ family response regulator